MDGAGFGGVAVSGVAARVAGCVFTRDPVACSVDRRGGASCCLGLQEEKAKLERTTVHTEHARRKRFSSLFIIFLLQRCHSGPRDRTGSRNHHGRKDYSLQSRKSKVRKCAPRRFFGRLVRCFGKSSKSARDNGTQWGHRIGTKP